MEADIYGDIDLTAAYDGCVLNLFQNDIVEAMTFFTYLGSVIDSLCRSGLTYYEELV